MLCTPIHTHRQLAEAAMRAGADVLLEKPPVPTMAEFEHLLALCAETGRSCQIGFQSLGSAAVAALALAVAAGSLGEVTSISTRCAWVRSVDYFHRSRWAGHRELDGIPVMDGVLTNPFAHAVATALRVDGSTRVEDVLSVETDLFRANDISSDDTSTVRVTTRRGTTMLLRRHPVLAGRRRPGGDRRRDRRRRQPCWYTGRRDSRDRSGRRDPDQRTGRQLRSRQPAGEPHRPPGRSQRPG